MKRVKLIVAYDGTAYSGWQVQNNGETIEGVLNRIISELTGEKITVIGASRTDAGVHALGNVAVFDTESPIPGEKREILSVRILSIDYGRKEPDSLLPILCKLLQEDWQQ